MATTIHPTAQVDRRAELDDGVVVGPHVVIEPDVAIGADCRLLAGAVVRRFTRMGPSNVVHPYCVLGGEPQDRKFKSEWVTHLQIGAGNVFREFVTLNRGSTPDAATVIGDRCYFMAQSHVGHDSVVGDAVILTNSAAIAGHCEIGPGAYLSANSGVHQFCWLGEMAMIRGGNGVSQHVPPFAMVMGLNYVAGLNVVALRRAEGFTAADRSQVKEAYRLLYRSSLTPARALERMDAHDEWGPPAGRFRDFVRRVVNAQPPHDRGLATARADQHPAEADL